MKQHFQHNPATTETTSEVSLIGQKLTDYHLLTKFRLNLTVVFSSVMAYLIAANGMINWTVVGMLFLGGFLVTGAANALNQVLEKDYDRLMKRTANRPIASGRMTISEGVMAAGFMSMIGIALLATINPWTALLGTISLITYSFIYTPMKRVSPIAVFIGAIPGALPMMIGCVAAEGSITGLSVGLFSLQFLWQLPHFWAIGWLAFEDYDKAGFKFLEAQDERLGKQSTWYALLLIPICWMPYLAGVAGIWAAVITSVLSVIYAGFGWNLYQKNNRKAALQLMFSSFFYLPLVLFVFYLL